MSRPSNPVLAWLTRASVLPVKKWLTSSCSRLTYGRPHRRIGMFSMADYSPKRFSIYSDGRGRGELTERAHATDAIPRILFIRGLALAFVPFHKSRDER